MRCLSWAESVERMSQLPLLAAGGSVALQVKATPSSTHKHIIAVVDSAGAVAEANEANHAIANALP
ncbi:MAG: CARDB domain-containing protein [Acidobacteriota bacterium]